MKIKILYLSNAEWIRQHDLNELPHFLTDEHLS
jgi:ferritin